MQERSSTIDYDFHKAEAKRLRATAIDGLFRHIAGLVSIRRLIKRAPRPIPTVEARRATTPVPG